MSAVNEDDEGYIENQGLDDPAPAPAAKPAKAAKAPAAPKSGKTISKKQPVGMGMYAQPQKRHRKALKDNIQGITRPALRRLARRAGVKRICGDIYDAERARIRTFLEVILGDAIAYTIHARRKTVIPMDIITALSRRGRTLYGFGY